MGQVTLTAPPTRDVGAVRAAAGAITVTTVSVLPVFLTGALAVQLGTELGFDPIGLGLVVALYFGVSALCAPGTAADTSVPGVHSRRAFRPGGDGGASLARAGTYSPG